MLSTKEPTKVIETTYEQWLQCPVRVTANQADINKYVDLDNPGLPVRDYRFRPKLKIVTEKEIANGYQPTNLDLHYSGEWRNMINGSVDREVEAEGMRLYNERLVLHRIGTRFDRNKKLYLNEVSYRHAIIQALVVEIAPYPKDRYELWEFPQEYYIWMLSLWNHVEMNPNVYGNIILREFARIASILFPCCNELHHFEESPIHLNQLRQLLTRLQELDHMILYGINYGRVFTVDIPPEYQNNQIMEGKLITMKTKQPVYHMIMVNEFGEFAPMPKPVEEEVVKYVVPADVIENDRRVSLADLAKRGQVYRLDDNGDYVQSLEPVRTPRNRMYIEDINILQQHPDLPASAKTPQLMGLNNDVTVNVNLTSPSSPYEYMMREKADHLERDKVAGRRRSYPKVAPTSHFNMNDLPGRPYDYEPDDDDDEEEDRPKNPVKLAKRLLKEHEELLRKLDKVNPGNHKKKASLESKLSKTEATLDAMERSGVEMPYHYRKQTIWTKFKRRIRRIGRKCHKFVTEHMDVFIATVSVALSVIGVIGKILASSNANASIPDPVPVPTEPIPV